MGKQIKTYTKEISLAFDPGNKKKFIMMKEANMEKILDILQNEVKIPNKDAILAMFADASQDVKDGIEAALKLLVNFKDSIPENFFSSLAGMEEYKTLAFDSKFVQDLEAQEKVAGAQDSKISDELQKKIDVLENENDEIKTKLETSRLTAMFDSFGLPDADVKTFVQTALTLQKADKAAADAYIKDIEKLSNVSKTAIKELGTSTAPDTHNEDAALSVLEKACQEIMKNEANLSYTEAMKLAVEKNPDAYSTVHKEV